MELLASTLGADLAGTAQGLSLRLTEVAGQGADGTRRRNALTGGEDILSGGFWLPVADFTPDAGSCASEVSSVPCKATERLSMWSAARRLSAPEPSGSIRCAIIIVSWA
jgi:hypothetical protein